MNRALLMLQLERHEGKRLKPYRDTAGKLTIGVGRNLDDVGLSEDEVDALLINDIGRVEHDLFRLVPCYSSLPDPQQRVLANMAFNLGVTGLLKFQHMLAAVAARDFNTAAQEMLDSAWAKQVGTRAIELADQMRA